MLVDRFCHSDDSGANPYGHTESNFHVRIDRPFYGPFFGHSLVCWGSKSPRFSRGRFCVVSFNPR